MKWPVFTFRFPNKIPDFSVFPYVVSAQKFETISRFRNYKLLTRKAWCQISLFRPKLEDKLAWIFKMVMEQIPSVHVILKKFSFSQRIPLYSATFINFYSRLGFPPTCLHFWVLSLSLEVMIYSKTVIVHSAHYAIHNAIFVLSSLSGLSLYLFTESVVNSLIKLQVGNL